MWFDKQYLHFPADLNTSLLEEEGWSREKAWPLGRTLQLAPPPPLLSFDLFNLPLKEESAQSCHTDTFEHFHLDADIQAYICPPATCFPLCGCQTTMHWPKATYVMQKGYLHNAKSGALDIDKYQV